MHNNDDMNAQDDQPATKGDLGLVRAELKEEIACLRAELKSENGETRRSLAIEIVKTQAAVEGLREDVTSSISGMESRITARMDSFMSNTMRVDRDNILLIHRMDKVEGRVADLERRTP